LRQRDPALWGSLATLRQAPAAAAGELACQLLGILEIRLDGVLLDRWPRRKAKLVLAALLIYPRGLAQEALAELLSRGEASDAALTTVHVNVSELRRVLQPALKKGEESRYVKLVGDRYVLDAARLAGVDVAAFDAAMREADGLKAGQPDQAEGAYERALAGYRGNLLDEKFFEGYFDEERESLRQRAVKALGWLASRYNRQRRPAEVERALTRMIALAPCEEEAYLDLMDHHLAQDRPELARQAYWDARRALKQQLGLAPGEELEAAFRALPN
ncbi:MAG: putative sensor protein, partial [Cyanobacteria bacterium RYN_339]|nr:putative sensor protein [Cyanobacteria bacterium RYN_339]